MNQEIVDKLNLTTSDCDKFMNVVDFFHKHKKKSASFMESRYTRIPNSLQNYGITMFDIEKFSEVFGVRIRKEEDLSMIDEPGDDLFFRVSDFDPETLRPAIQELKNNIQEKQARIILYLNNNSLQRDYKEQTLTCVFEEGAPYNFILNLVKDKNPKKRSVLGKESANWSRTTEEVNKRTSEKLLLKEPLIVNNKGYQIDREKYYIVYKK